MASEIKRFYEFGGFEFDAQRLTLQYQKEAVHLPPKSLQTLKILLEKRGETVNREVLISEIWHDAFVEDSNLTVAVSTLRKTLAAAAGADGLIQTVPRSGYRFVGDVSEKVHVSEQPIIIERHKREELTIESDDPEHVIALRVRAIPWISRRAAMAAVPVAIVILLTLAAMWRSADSGDLTTSGSGKIAVVPFRSAGGAADDLVLRLGITDSLITRLNANERFKVSSLSSVGRFLESELESAEIARRLGADKVFDGTYQIFNGRIRVSLRLINVADGRLLWQDTFDGELSDVFRLQDRVATAAARELGIADERVFAPRRPTENADAYRLFLKGQHLLRMRGANVQKSIPYLERAIELDPNFAAAYAASAAAYGMTSGYLEMALPAVETALQLEPDLAEAHAVKGFLAIYHKWDWQEARESLDRALELDPQSVSAYHWRGELNKLHGRFTEAESDLHRGLELDPLSFILISDLAQLHYFAGNDNAAINFAQQALDIDPGHQYANVWLSRALHRLGRYEEALEHHMIYSIAENQIKTPEEVTEYRSRIRKLFKKGGPDSVSSMRYERQKRLLNGSEDFYERIGARINIAKYEASKGRTDRAINELSTAFAELQRSGRLKGFRFYDIAVNPSFEPLRSNERFRRILHEMGLPG